MIMCDGTNSFWCEHGGKCAEIVQGENYACKCLPGFIGEHCQHSGITCGRIHCFHEAKCLVEDEVCECPSDWKGSVDCSLPTLTQTDSSANSAASIIPQPGENFNSSSNWMVVALAISCSAGTVAGGAIYAKKLIGKKESAAPKFQQLPQSQIHDLLDDDEDRSMVNDNNHSHH